MSTPPDGMVRIAPEPTPEEAEAVRQALAALGLIEDAGDDRRSAAGQAESDT